MIPAIALLTAALLATITGAELDERLQAVDALVDEREFAAADSTARALLAEAEATFGESSLEAARVLDQLVDARFGLQTVDEECLALIERAVRLKESAAGPESPELAASLSLQGEVLQALQRSPEARPIMERALTIQEKHFGRGSPEAADVLSRLAQVYIDLDLEVDAARMLEETLAIRDAAPDPDPKTLAYLLYNLARLERALGEFADSESHYRRLLELTPDTGDGRRAYVLNSLGTLYVEQARFAEGQEVMEESVAIARQAGLPSGSLGYFLHNLGFALASLGDFESAIRTYEEALEIRRAVHGNEHRNTAATLANLANAYRSVGDLEKASTLHAEALAIRERVTGEESGTVATSLTALAEIDLERGRPEEAVPRMERVLRIRTNYLGEDHYDTAKAKSDLARARVATGDLESAEELFREALPVLEGSLGRDSPAWGEACVSLASVRAWRGNVDEAWELAREAEERARGHARWTAAALGDRQARRFAALRKRAHDLLISLALDRSSADDVPVVWDHVIRSRALVLDEIAKRREELDPDTDPETRRLQEEYRKAATDLARLLVAEAEEADADAARSRVLEARRACERVERELASRTRESRRDPGCRASGLDDVLAAAPADAAIVAYIRYERTRLDAPGAEPRPSYVAFVRGAGRSAPVLVDLGDASDIDRRVAGWRTEVVPTGFRDPREAVRRYRIVGTELREAIWDPIVAPIGAAPLVFMIPDGELLRVSFPTLPTDGNRYLVEEEPGIHLLSAERNLVVPPDAGRGDDGLLAVGGVDFGDAPDTATVGATPFGFPPLPATRPEVEAVAATWRGKVDLLTGAEATESAIKALAPEHRVVHLATHGVFRGRKSAVRMAGSRGIGGLSARPARSRSPLTLSGIVLAGANHPVRGAQEEDGILTAQEIAALDFSGTDWVVLSACDTGLGDIESGEGVVGLRRAFEVSGAKTLIMSLWDVDDEATRRWMESLYRNRFERGMSTVESVSGAARTTLEWCRTRRGTDHPFFWGAFVAVGRWE